MRYTASLLVLLTASLLTASPALAERTTAEGDADSAPDPAPEADAKTEQASTSTALNAAPSIDLVERSAFGKAVFLVQPQQDCTASHTVEGAERALDCRSSYVVVCDANKDNAPLCVIR